MLNRAIFLIFLYIFLFSNSYALTLTLHDTPTAVYFSPHGGAQQAIVNAIGQARQSVLVQAYALSNRGIICALRDVARRGVNVQVIQDAQQLRAHPQAACYLHGAGVSVYFENLAGIAHNKVMVIDGDVVVTGSFNFTKAAEEHNAENVLILRDQKLARLYMENWERHRGHSEEYNGCKKG